MKHIPLRLDRLIRDQIFSIQSFETTFAMYFIMMINERFINLELRKPNTILRMLVPRKLTDTHRRIIIG